VADTGIGIPKDKQTTVFEAFRQADADTSRRSAGTGLGLAICARLAALMGGDLRVNSEPGRGSEFTFTFRAEPAAPPVLDAAPAEAPAAQVSQPSLRILVAEDNRVNQMLIRQVLERSGHEVVLARNGREAVEQWRSRHFDAIFMDVNMPEMDGLEAARQIRAEELRSGAAESPVPIIALTACAMAEDRVRCQQSGMSDFLEKPLDRRRLQQILDQVSAHNTNWVT
jgi:CheY-like chemotaxis protein